MSREHIYCNQRVFSECFESNELVFETQVYCNEPVFGEHFESNELVFDATGNELVFSEHFESNELGLRHWLPH